MRNLDYFHEEELKNGDRIATLNANYNFTNAKNVIYNYISKNYNDYTPEKYNSDVIIHTFEPINIIYSMRFKNKPTVCYDILSSNNNPYFSAVVFITKEAWEYSGITNIKIPYTKEEYKQKYSSTKYIALYSYIDLITYDFGYNGVFTFSDGSIFNGAKELIEYLFDGINYVWCDNSKYIILGEPTFANCRDALDSIYPWINNVNDYFTVEESDTLKYWPEDQELFYTPLDGQKYYYIKNTANVTDETVIPNNAIFINPDSNDVSDAMLYYPKLMYGEEPVLNSLISFMEENNIILLVHIPSSVEAINMPEQYATQNSIILNYIFPFDDTTLFKEQQNIKYIYINKDITSSIDFYGDSAMLIEIINEFYANYKYKFVYKGNEYTLGELNALAQS